MAYNVCIKPMNINKRRDERTDDWMVKNRACRGWWLPLALFFFVILHYQEPITWHYLKISYQQRYERRRRTPKKGFYHLCSKFTWVKRWWEGRETERSLPLPPHFICVSIFWEISKINGSSMLRTLHGKGTAEVIFKKHYLCLLSFKPFFSKIIFFFTK